MHVDFQIYPFLRTSEQKKILAALFWHININFYNNSESYKQRMLLSERKHQKLNRRAMNAKVLLTFQQKW